MTYKAGSRVRIKKTFGKLTSYNGVIVKVLTNFLRRVQRDGLITVETWHTDWFTREHRTPSFKRKR
jgi:hypothetical protein